MAQRVLIIDDSPAVREQLCELLSEAGYDTLLATDGLEGRKQILAHLDLSLVICDVNMPGMNGLDLLDSLQQEFAERRLRVVMLTTEAQPSAMARATKAGAKGWILKPFNESLLVSAVRKITQQPP